jgi:hypothetical protein
MKMVSKATLALVVAAVFVITAVIGVGAQQSTRPLSNDRPAENARGIEVTVGELYIYFSGMPGSNSRCPLTFIPIKVQNNSMKKQQVAAHVILLKTSGGVHTPIGSFDGEFRSKKRYEMGTELEVRRNEIFEGDVRSPFLTPYQESWCQETLMTSRMEVFAHITVRTTDATIEATTNPVGFEVFW